MEVTVFPAVLVMLAGLLTGSFLNVCIHRVPKGESIVFPQSHCPKCNAQLTAKDLIPLLSFLLLRGSCRYCGKKISSRYPAVEALNAFLYVCFFLKYGISSELFFSAIFISALIVIFFTDLETSTIHDWASITAGAAGFLYGVVTGNVADSIFGILIGGCFIYLLRTAGSWIYKREAMGEGDIWLAAALGAYLGPRSIVLTLFLSFIIAAAGSLILIAFKLKTREDEIPFGPSLVAAAAISMFFGNIILRFYLGY